MAREVLVVSFNEAWLDLCKKEKNLLEKWELSEGLYKVALKAVSNERNQRQQSIRQFIDEWNKVKETTASKRGNPV